MGLRSPKAGVALVGAVIAVGLIAGLTSFSLAAGGVEADSALPVVVPQASFPGLAAPSGEPELDGIVQAKPRPGEIVQVLGPFDERFELEGLAFDGTTVRGAVRVTSDVSEVLELQVLAGFYNDQGALLGTNRFVHHLADDGDSHTGSPEEREDFAIEVPAELASQAVSVALGVPVLVNE